MDERDPPPFEAVVEEMLQVTGQLVRRLRAESHAAELTLSQGAVLKRLDKNGPMTTADLARAEAVKPQSMGATLSSLEQDGLVERQPHPTDGRQILFTLTPEGMETRRRHRLLKREWLSTAMAKLDAEEKQALTVALGIIRRFGDA